MWGGAARHGKVRRGEARKRVGFEKGESARLEYRRWEGGAAGSGARAAEKGHGGVGARKKLGSRIGWSNGGEGDTVKRDDGRRGRDVELGGRRSVVSG
jgi:hypothetical protein